MTKLTRNDLLHHDANDPLAGTRNRFELPAGTIYLDGNSLGPLPKQTPERVNAVMHEQWGQDLIKSWNVHDWIDLPARVGDKIARIIGAEENSVVCTDSTSINVFKMLAAALKLRPDRRIVLSDTGNFPTDLYMAQGLVELLDGDYQLRIVEEANLVDAIDEETAVMMVTHVNYRTGYRHDMAGVTRVAHDAGALMLWDLAHSAGAMSLDVAGCDVDLAVGCGYKYLNGGPGAPAFLYVAPRLQDDVRPPLSGWLGHEAPFDFDLRYRPATGIDRNRVGTPPILSMAALDAGLDVMLDADLDAVREKSLALGDIFIDLVEQECGDFGVELVSPRTHSRRGSQVSFRHPKGYAVMQALIARDVIGDFRAPDIIRFGFAPLYIRYVDIWDAVAALREILETREWDAPEFKQRSKVT